MTDPVKKHVKSVMWIRDELYDLDDFANPVIGIRDFDDAVCLRFDGIITASSDGPYTKRLVMKSALVHAATDVAVKGAIPIFALDCVIGVEEDVREMIGSLKKQARHMRIALIGGNTLIEEADPRCSITVFGKLMTKEPIRDCGAKSGDVVALFGKPIWGEQDERLELAKLMFDTWFEALKKVHVNAAKDVTKGGLVATIYELEEKSKIKITITDQPYLMARNLDNFIITLPEDEYIKLGEICSEKGCELRRIGSVT